jgi:hypothetical protein
MNDVEDKTELLDIIRRAKSSHVRWRAYAQGLVAGVDVKDENLPVKHTDCRFGKWYFGHGTQVFGDLPVFSDIQGAHEMLHAVYEQIYDLVKQKDLSSAQNKLTQMMDISRTLLELLNLLEEEIESRQ